MNAPRSAARRVAAAADFAVRDEEGNLHPEAAPGQAPHLFFLNGLEPDHFYSGSPNRAPGRADKPPLIGP
jgi:hypothetical protein